MADDHVLHWLGRLRSVSGGRVPDLYLVNVARRLGGVQDGVVMEIVMEIVMIPTFIFVPLLLKLLEMVLTKIVMGKTKFKWCLLMDTTIVV